VEVEIWNHYKHFWNCLKTKKDTALLAMEEQSKCSGPWRNTFEGHLCPLPPRSMQTSSNDYINILRQNQSSA